MAVNFTPNIGLAKPTESEVAKNWVANSVDLNGDNLAILVPKLDIVIIDQSFSSGNNTFTVVGPTTAPNFGIAGDAKGEYSEFMGFVWGGFNINCGDPGVASGSGTGAYGIKLPTLVDNTFHIIGNAFNQVPGSLSCIGEGYWSDASSVAGSGTVAIDVVRVGGVDYARMITETYAGKTAEWVGPGIPAGLATNDQLSGQFFYKRA